ncbi:Endonuclease, Uma2 family (restriction endonuclease fold) [Belliella buryatensis]|uniref:Endonuclease, Uma2 family (Restriction endonuclease fold) n=1 Tax=Belliella buryatensis TaxID=1500549 RepID=A0A239DUU2_9BACT|nr:Uma2 family endonuclease [Belliella buryatensis]SNS36097.1 Endonuclease, Uma2 family (restriction endonuclease fold) [Belliella buryatensis]
MGKDDLKSRVEEPPSLYGHYTYADYLTWKMDEMVELIKGKIFKQAAAPRVNHQRLSLKISTELYSILKGKKCEVFAAPFDVRLPVKSKKHEDIDTVVQPDICVVCDPDKLDELGCVGAPDLIVEILSPGNNRKELQNKYEVYEESGVKEYWVIHPNECTLLIYNLINGKYQASKLFTHGDVVKSDAVEGFQLDLSEIFENIQ